MPRPVIVRLSDAALQYAIPKRTIQRWIAEERLINHGTPRRVRVDLWEIDQLYRLRESNSAGRLPRSA